MITSVYVAVFNRSGGFVEGRRFRNPAQRMKLARFLDHCTASGLQYEEMPE